MLLTSRLKINGVEIAHSGYNLETPPGGLGRSLTVALSKPDSDLIPPGATISFELGAGQIVSGSPVYSWVTYLSGIINGKDISISWVADDSGGYPGDVVEFSSLSPLLNKLNLAPLRPVIMFNPETIPAANLIPAANAGVIYNGAYILPKLEPIEDLDLYKVLNRAYTATPPQVSVSQNNTLSQTYGANYFTGDFPGLGFSSVITNLPNFPVDRVDFTIEGGFHNPIKSLIGLFNPEVFESEGVLYLIDPDLSLPEGMPIKTYGLDCVVSVKRTSPVETISNGVILTYRQNSNLYGGERLEIEIINEPPYVTGSGEAYTRTEVSREVTKYIDTNTGNLRREVENWKETKTYAYRDNIVMDGDGNRERQPGEIKLVSSERIINRYTGKVKSGHTKTLDGMYQNPETGLDTSGRILTEECYLLWTPDLNAPGSSIQIRSETTVSGLVLVETKEDGLTVFTPILSATNNGLIESDNSQSLIDRPIYTYIEELQTTAPNQTNVEPRLVNHLSGGIEPLPVSSRPGSRSNAIPPLTLRGAGASGGYVKELITNAESVALNGLRGVTTLEIGDLDPVEGRRLALIKLAKAENPPLLLSLALPGIDFSVRRGKLCKTPLRSGAADVVSIVTGDSITGRGIGTPGETHLQNITLREVYSS